MDASKTIEIDYTAEKRYTAKGAKAYSFCAYGYGTVSIYVNGEVQKSIRIDNNEFTVYKGTIENTDSEVELIFDTEYSLVIKNVALYRDRFRDDSRVPEFEEYVNYDLKELAQDFYQLDNNEIMYRDNGYYNRCTDFYIEGKDVLVLPRDKKGTYDIYYRAYPIEITAATEDDYVLPLAPEIIPLLPLYMASQLYKDDDNGIATSYRNEFEVAFERLSNGGNVPVREQFVSESGWI